VTKEWASARIFGQYHVDTKQGSGHQASSRISDRLSTTCEYNRNSAPLSASYREQCSRAERSIQYVKGGDAKDTTVIDEKQRKQGTVLRL
jgi:hypothetical protein